MELLAAGVPPRTRRRTLAAVGAAVTVLVALTVGVLADVTPQIRFDGAVSRALYAGDDRSAAHDAALEVLTSLGTVWFRALAYLPVLLWLAVRRRWRTLGWVLAAVALVGPLTTAAKDLVGRARPAFESGGLEYGSLSFPSGHSSGIATLVVVGLVLAWPRLAPAARRAATAVGVGVAVLVGLTRLWLGVHFPSDVLGGWALGIAWSLGAALLLGGLPGGPAALAPREDRS